MFAAATSSKDLSVRQEVKSSFDYQPPAAAAEPVIDMASLDLNDYINAQQSPQKSGGLFD